MGNMSRTIEAGVVIIKDFKEGAELFRKEFPKKVTAGDIVGTINEFTDTKWDGVTPWKHETESTYEIYECSDEDFMKIAKPLTGEAKAKRIASMEKQREKRAKAK